MNKRKLLKISLLGVFSGILMFLEFPTFIFPVFLKMDFSDLPAIIGAFAMGPLAGVLIELIKNVIHGLFASSTVLIGELANFVVGTIFVATAGLIYKYNKTKKRAYVSLSIGVIAMSVGATIFNYYLFIPLYEKFLGVKIESLINLSSRFNNLIVDLKTLVFFTIFPFNFLKGIIISIITIIIYKKLSHLF